MTAIGATPEFATMMYLGTVPGSRSRSVCSPPPAGTAQGRRAKGRGRHGALCPALSGNDIYRGKVRTAIISGSRSCVCLWDEGVHAACGWECVCVSLFVCVCLCADECVCCSLTAAGPSLTRTRSGTQSVSVAITPPWVTPVLVAWYHFRVNVTVSWTSVTLHPWKYH